MNSGLDRCLNSESVPRKSRLNWREHETKVFLKSWKDHMYINRLIKKGCSKHPIYYAISKDLQKCGYSRSMNEIYFKMKNLTKRFRKANANMPVHGGIIDFRYYKEVEELLRLEAEVGTKDCPGTAQVIEASEQPQIIIDGSYIEGITSENVQVIRLSVPEHQEVSDSNAPQTYTVINVAGTEVPNETEVVAQDPTPPSTSSNSQKAPENLLLGFYQEFERSNRQLEKNDAAMLELFKEQNDIFRTQTTLLMKLLLK